MEVFMKKLILVLVLSILMAGAVFAQHPAGWGIGVVGSTAGWDWKGFGYTKDYGLALSLRLPSGSTYWGVHLNIKPGFKTVGISGDRYLIDKIFIPGISVGFYVGIGLYAGATFGSGYLSIAAKARLPIGIYIMPIKFLEVFAAAVPNIGGSVEIKPTRFGNGKFPYGSIAAEVGVRFWF
jgi:opacity protein-like surface antigen